MGTTPTDSAEPVEAKKRAPAKRRGARGRVLGAGEGDYCIYRVIPPGREMPAGSLVPIPEVPRFTSTQHAERWIRNESGDRLTGMQVMIFRATELLNLEITMKATVQINRKPKVYRDDLED